MTIFSLLYSFPNCEPAHCSKSDSNCFFLPCIQVFQETGKVVWYSHLFKNYVQFSAIHTVKGFSVVSEGEVNIVIEFPCFFYDPVDVDNFIFVSSAFSKSSLYIWKFSVHVLLKPGLKDFEFATMWNEHSCTVIWTLCAISFLWDWNENWPFPVLWPLLSFPNFLAYWVQHFHSITF